MSICELNPTVYEKKSVALIFSTIFEIECLVEY